MQVQVVVLDFEYLGGYGLLCDGIVVSVALCIWGGAAYFRKGGQRMAVLVEVLGRYTTARSRGAPVTAHPKWAPAMEQSNGPSKAILAIRTA